MLVRSPRRGQTKWLLAEAASTGQQNRPPKGQPSGGRHVLDGWVSGLGYVVGGGLSSVADKLSNEGPLYKTSGPHVDEVSRSRRPPISPIVVPVGRFP